MRVKNKAEVLFWKRPLFYIVMQISKALLSFLAIWLALVSSANCQTPRQTRNASANQTLISTTVFPGKLGVVYKASVNSSHQVLYQFDGLENELGSFRVYSSSLISSLSYPLDVVVRQSHDVLSWELPLAVKGHTYRRVNRTLCPADVPPSRDRRRIVISLSTASPVDLEFEISLFSQPNFQLSMDQELDVQVSPSTPIFYEFAWPSNVSYALLRFKSPDSYCTVLSIQNKSCPVYDLVRNVKFEGQYQTVNRKTGLSFTRDKYPHGLFIVLVVRPDDSSCKVYKELDGADHGPPGWRSRPLEYDRLKQVTLQVTSQLTSDEYLIATTGAIAIFLGMYILVFVISCAIFIKGTCVGGQGTSDDADRLTAPSNGIEIEDRHDDDQTEEGGGIVSVAAEVHDNGGFAQPGGVGGGGASASFVDDIMVDQPSQREAAAAANNDAASDSSLDETDIDMLHDADWEKEIFRAKKYPFVTDLARKSHRTLSRKFTLYHWNLWTIAIFYSLPVVQLMVTYQKITNSTGDQDLCYYNFLCAHPLGVLSDFNHVYSNLGYVLLGALFMIIVRYKEYKELRDKHKRRHLVSGNVQLLNQPLYGIPQHFGMYKAMGLGLIMEGLMSACYHVCPNHTNFQFDTAFMYTLSILIVMKLYQMRHPDVTANAYTAYGTLAFVIFVGVIGVLNGSTIFWIIFSAVHVIVCLVLSTQVYYMGRVKYDSGFFKRFYWVCSNDFRAFMGGHFGALKPVYPDRTALLLVWNAINWGLLAFGMTDHGRKLGFASFLLAIFMTNVMLYITFYLVMKLRHGEKIRLQPAVYLVMSCLSWAGAGYFFFNSSTSSHESPAMSRWHNQDCIMLHFYDNHDIWHFLSAISLFLGFMILLTLDDDLKQVPREKIPVF